MYICIFCGLKSSNLAFLLLSKLSRNFPQMTALSVCCSTALPVQWIGNNRIAFGRQRGITLVFIFLLNSDIETGELLIYGMGSCYKSNVNCVKSLFFSPVEWLQMQHAVLTIPTPVLTSVSETELYCWKLIFFAGISVKARNGKNQQVNSQA